MKSQGTGKQSQGNWDSGQIKAWMRFISGLFNKFLIYQAYQESSYVEVNIMFIAKSIETSLFWDTKIIETLILDNLTKFIHTNKICSL